MQLKVFDTLTDLVARISNRAMVGLPLCRNPNYIHAIVHFAEQIVPYSLLLQRVPRIARGLVIRLFKLRCFRVCSMSAGRFIGWSQAS